MKLPGTAFSPEEVRSANDVQSRISGAYTWHWLLTAGANISVVAGTQDYTMNATDQNAVMAIATANLLSGSTELAALNTTSHPMLPRGDSVAASRERPYAMGLISPTQVRYYPVPDATYTGKWTYYARPIVFTVNTNTYQCPDNFENVILSGNIWKIFQLLDDDRAAQQEQDFLTQIALQIEQEKTTTGKHRTGNLAAEIVKLKLKAAGRKQ
jgi:hypothetical protein